MIPGASAPQPAAGGSPMPPQMPAGPHPPMAPGGPPPTPSPMPPPAQPPAPPPMMVFDAQSFAAAVQLLRDDRLRGFRADIETESTVIADQHADQQSASEFVQAIGAFLQSSLPMMQAMPQITPILGKVLMFMVRRFRVGVELESTMEDAIAKLEGQGGAPQMQNPKQAEQQQKMQMDQQRLQADMAMKQQEMQQDQAAHQMDLQGKQVPLQADVVRAEAEMKRATMDEQMARMDHQRSIELAHTQAALAAQQPMQVQKLEFGAGRLTRGDR